MALLLTKADALFVHIPKCSGHFVEDVLKACGIEYERSEPITNSCSRHAPAKDHKPASFTFCSTRELEPWMKSYWRFHMLMGHNQKIWQPGREYPHRVLGPPMLPWQEFVKQKAGECREYLEFMQVGCERFVRVEHIVNDLTSVLQQVGYEVTREQVAAVPNANVTHLKIELGGGTRSRGDGFANIDLVDEADFKWNLDQAPYPFPDESVNELYSSHCLEHLDCPHKTLAEIARICVVGAPVEIRVPHPCSHMAMCAGHKHVFSPQMVDNIDFHFPELHWTGPRRLKLQSLEYGPSPWLPQAKRDMPFLQGLDDQTIMRWIPQTCHESIFRFVVQENMLYEE